MHGIERETFKPNSLVIYIPASKPLYTTETIVYFFEKSTKFKLFMKILFLVH